MCKTKDIRIKKIREKGGIEMKGIARYILIVMGVIALAMILPMDSVYAVHKGAGGLDCSGCHTMHNSQQGSTMGGGPTGRLLKAADTEGLCLSCHDTAGSQYTTYQATVPAVKGTPSGTPAAGNFTDLDGTNDAAGQTAKGKGHNLGEGAATLTPPGGASMTGFTCTNCHDPHGVSTDSTSVSAFRNLRFNPTGSGGGGPSVINAGPAEGTLASAVYPETTYYYGKVTGGAALSNISQWCGTCHDSFYGDSNTGTASPYTRHATGNPTTAHNLSAVDYTNYSGVTEASRFPAEDSATSATANSSNTTNKAAGNESADGVLCLSCHKAHATANTDSLRWSYAAAAQSSPGSACQQCHNK